MNKRDLTIVVVSILILVVGFFLYQNYVQEKVVGIETYVQPTANILSCVDYCDNLGFRSGSCTSECTQTEVGPTKDCEMASPQGKTIEGENCCCTNYPPDIPCEGKGLPTRPVYRLYSPTQKDHFYTTSEQEKNNAQSKGYNYAGIMAYIYSSGRYKTEPVYRLYSSAAKDHFYTTSEQEKDNAEGMGYRYEGIIGRINSGNFGIKIIDTLEEGETGIYTFLGKEYNVEVVIITDTSPEKVTFRVNGELADQLGEGEIEVLDDGTLIGVIEITSNDKVKFYLSRGVRPVYRLYNPKVKDHFYTTDEQEKNNARDNLGYNYEGILGYALEKSCSESVGECKGEGGVFFDSTIPPGVDPCCEGLTPVSIFNKLRMSGNILKCDNPILGAKVCTKCGDGIPGIGENVCNCPEDFVNSECEDACEEKGMEVSKCVHNLLEYDTSACGAMEMDVGIKICPSDTFASDYRDYGSCCCLGKGIIHVTTSLECEDDEFEVYRESWSSSGNDPNDKACCDVFDDCVYDGECYDINDVIEMDDDKEYVCVLDPSEDYEITDTLDEGEDEEYIIYSKNFWIEVLDVDEEDKEARLKEKIEEVTLDLDEGEDEDLPSGANIKIEKVYSSNRVKFILSYMKTNWVRCDDENGDYCEACGYDGYDEEGGECYDGGGNGGGTTNYTCDYDGNCEPGQGENLNTCPEDCGVPPTARCGDGNCDPSESEFNCPKDCESNVIPPYSDCGNGVCNFDENEFTCPEDCVTKGKTCNLWIPLLLILLIIILGLVGYKYTKKQYILYIASGLLVIGMLVDLIYNCYWWLWLIFLILTVSGVFYYNKYYGGYKEGEDKTVKKPVKKLSPNQSRVLKEYVQKTRKQGFKDPQIKKSLEIKGWPKEDIDNLLGNKKR